MKFCQHCGKELIDEAVVCTGCGRSVAVETSSAPIVVTDDNISIGLCLLAVFVPAFGIIYWPVKHRATPRRAMACGICGIIGYVASLLLIVLLYM